MNLYQMTEEMVALESRLDVADESEAKALQAELTDLLQKMPGKLEGVVKWFKNYSALETALKDEEARLRARRKACENHRNALKAALEAYMILSQQNEVYAGAFKLKMVESGQPPVLVKEGADVPARFKITSEEISLTLIREALLDGEALDFASFGERKASVRIS